MTTAEERAEPIRVGLWVLVAVIAGIGVTNGLLTLLAFGTLGAGWNTLGNSGAIWLLVAFGVGALMPTAGLAIAGATASLVGSVVWFYMAAHYLVGMPVSSAGIAIWLLASVAGGPVYGLAGHWWHHGIGARHVVGLALMGGVFIAEVSSRCSMRRRFRSSAGSRSASGRCSRSRSRARAATVSSAWWHSRSSRPSRSSRTQRSTGRWP